MDIPSSVISAQWLNQHIDHPSITVLDASWFMPGSGRFPQQEWAAKRIPDSLFFDFDNKIKSHESPLPHMLPTAEGFAYEVSKLGISNDSTIIIYDTIGLFSSPRAWWMFKAMGHHNVAVLDGGLPAWLAAGGEIETHTPHGNIAPSSYIASRQPNWIASAQDVSKQLTNEAVTIVDARPAERFAGKQIEPRAGVRSGHMPNAKNLPFAKVVFDGKLADKSRLNKYFDELAPTEQQYIFSCGSGITACILALAAEQTGRKHIAVYDGSWTEWGSNEQYPVVKEE
ncbi:sulfurtransferase [Photobacterium kagoshimensis]|uniref:sulfurtransferase n=1 Tax=Photobacterium kagoshimensis TaxID=2910242 RepID=UPI003D1154BA